MTPRSTHVIVSPQGLAYVGLHADNRSAAGFPREASSARALAAAIRAAAQPKGDAT